MIALEERLRKEVQGDVAFDAVTRALYATDASIYQIEPRGVVIPKTVDDIAAVVGVCREAGVPVLPRGAGTSQCGQTVGNAVVVDTSKHLREIEDIDTAGRRVRVQPGLVLDHLNARLKREGLFFPIDPSTASRATLGGMTANNSSGARSIRYGMMVHNVIGIDAILADGTRAAFNDAAANGVALLIERLRAIATREADEIAARFPHVMRRVGGYNLDAIKSGPFNTAKILVGSEGTLAFFTSIELLLQPLPRERVLGICHFPRFHDAMASTKELVKSDPVAIELVDRTMLELSRANPTFAPTIERYVNGRPDTILLVEFTGDDASLLRPKLDELDERMSALGFPNAVVKVTESAAQSEIWSVRSAGLNIMTSMKGDAKPISIIEDCAVDLEHLADYTAELTQIFEKYGTYGTWYAHASVGCLHVRPVLNVKHDEDVGKLRAIAEEAFALVREYGGSHSGEHGDGIVRSEFHREMFGERIVRAFEDVKDAFDPKGLFNPGKIVRAPLMDDRSLFRYPPGYEPIKLDTVLDWSDWGGFSSAVEMCNNNGACRKVSDVMCPSYMVTQDEEHVTRGRANALRHALTGQLGRDALTSDRMYDVLDLCVSCKGCRRECPTGVDMARMKLEFLYHYRKKHGWRTKDRIVASLPRYAPLMKYANAPTRLRNALGVLARGTEKLSGFSAKRSIPVPAARPFLDDSLRRQNGPPPVGEVVLFVDTFNRYFEPHNARAALRVLEAAKYDVIFPTVRDRGRPLCCGRTYLGAGMVDEARREMQRVVEALEEPASRGVPIIGLEPSCLLTLRDELLAVAPSDAAKTIALQAMLLEEFLVREQQAGRLKLDLHPLQEHKAFVHGHCHQKAFGAFAPVVQTLRMIPSLEVVPIDSSCCGMAGSFGYEIEHYEISKKMAERTLLPAVRSAGENDLIVTDGTSCRHQIADLSDRKALHVARVLELALR
ncbi:MAG: FAD-linked oxidase C-terminal domain-containing protein [Vulcanimicrobiaceae bacterium]